MGKHRHGMGTERYRLFIEDVRCCVYCGGSVTLISDPDGRLQADAATVDHFVPIQRCGKVAHHPDNLVLACFRCNNAKGSLPALVFMARLRDMRRESSETQSLIVC